MSPPSKELMHFNPRSPHGERRAADDQRVAAVGISTHAPRTGSDAGLHSGAYGRTISTHAPRTGSDRNHRRADCPIRFISTHAPRTGSDPTACWFSFYDMDISTHAPRTGSDCPFAASTGQKSAYFNPRSPHGERPADKRCNQLRKHFNPRSPHGERPVVGGSNCFQNDFNPRSPHGERLVARQLVH